MTTTVINIKDAPQGWSVNDTYVYIGRKRPGFSGVFGNPFPLYVGTTRGIVIRKYKAWFYAPEQSAFRDLVFTTLANKTLVCYCKPATCHGDIIVEYIDRLHLKL